MTGLVDTSGKLTAGVNVTGGQQYRTVSIFEKVSNGMVTSYFISRKKCGPFVLYYK
jgi:hypothetical protein